MTSGELMNPFRVWAELGKGLRDRFVAEMGQADVTPYAGEVLGMIAALVTRCEHLGTALQRMHDHDAEAYDAFLRALEGS